MASQTGKPTGQEQDVQAHVEGEATVRSPTAASQAEQETFEEASWTNIAAYLQNPVGPRPVVLCAMCTEQIAIPILQPSNSEREPALKLFPCNHIVGRNCWTMQVAILKKDGKKPFCPYCRKPVDGDGNERKPDPKGNGGGRRREGDDNGESSFPRPTYDYGTASAIMDRDGLGGMF